MGLGGYGYHGNREKLLRSMYFQRGATVPRLIFEYPEKFDGKKETSSFGSVKISGMPERGKNRRKRVRKLPVGNSARSFNTRGRVGD